MPLMHCMKCDNEWEATSDKSLCTWCGEGGYVIDPSTPLERMLNDRERVKRIIRETKDKRR